MEKNSINNDNDKKLMKHCKSQEKRELIKKKKLKKKD